MIVLVDFDNPDRPPVMIVVDDDDRGYDPAPLAEQLRTAARHAARVRLFKPGQSIDSDREGAPEPAQMLEDLADRLPPKREPAHTDHAADVDADAL